MKKKAILQGILVDYSGVVLMVLAGLIAVPYYLHYISKEEYGLWLAINSVVTMVALVDLATDQFLMTVTSNDQKFFSAEYADYLTSILLVKTISAAVVAAVSSVMFVFLDSLVDLGIGSRHDAQLSFALAISGLVFGIFANSFSAILYARHHYSLVNGYTNFFSIASTVGTIFLLKEHYGIAAFPIALLIGMVLQGAIFLIILIRRFPHLRLRVRNFKFVGKSEILGYATNFQALRWLYTFRAQYISVAINNLSGPASLTQYMLTSRLTQLGPTFAAKFAQAFFPSLADLFEKGDTRKVGEVFLKVSKVLARVAILAGIILGTLNESFVAIWVGEDKYAGDATLICIVLVMMLYIAMALFAIVIFASKRFERWVYWGMAEIVMAVALSYTLSLWYGLLGVVMGFALASLPTQMYLFRIVLGQLELGAMAFLGELVRYAVKPNFIPLLGAFIVAVLHVEMNTWIALIGLASLLLLLHFAVEAVQILRCRKPGLRNKIADVLKV